MRNKIVVSSYRAYSSREQARLIRQEANVLIDKANEFSTTSRRVNRRSAYKVLARSLEKTRGLPFSIRKHQAIAELSNYIALAKYNKVVGLEAFIVCSTWRIRQTSNILAAKGSGSFSFSIYRKLAA